MEAASSCCLKHAWPAPDHARLASQQARHLGETVTVSCSPLADASTETATHSTAAAASSRATLDVEQAILFELAAASLKRIQQEKANALETLQLVLCAGQEVMEALYHVRGLWLSTTAPMCHDYASQSRCFLRQSPLTAVRSLSRLQSIT